MKNKPIFSSTQTEAAGEQHLLTNGLNSHMSCRRVHQVTKQVSLEAVKVQTPSMPFLSHAAYGLHAKQGQRSQS